MKERIKLKKETKSVKIDEEIKQKIEKDLGGDEHSLNGQAGKTCGIC